MNHSYVQDFDIPLQGCSLVLPLVVKAGETAVFSATGSASARYTYPLVVRAGHSDLALSVFIRNCGATTLDKDNSYRNHVQVLSQ